MFNYKQSAMLAPRPQQPKTANKNVANVENYPHTHTAVATLQLCRTKPIRSDTSLNQFTVSKNKHKYDTELFFAFDKNNANWSRRRSWAGGGVASETATISNFILHIFTALRYVGLGEGQKEAVPGNPNKFTL